MRYGVRKKKCVQEYVTFSIYGHGMFWILFWQTVFKRANGQSAVYHQPESQEERFTALQALLACPTASIRTENPPQEIKSVHASFPIPVDPQNLEVYFISYRRILQENFVHDL